MAALHPRARRFRKAVVDNYDLDPGDVVVLDLATTILSEIEAMEVELAGADVMVKGSRGQPVIHPLVGELRAHRLAFGALMGRLKLPGEATVEDGKAKARSSKARRAALARWHGGSPA